ncbi:hypothetical protein NFO65_28385 [Neorhizobium galegae]|uniref:oxidoreductase n=1 Tax=Neorhizobium galegae TaxID=399 RepID=UPI002101A97E|nr:hypothetical protein [Neorhizobium galegae]MCQ1574640.1 hypothetical protein [Neorhizobium galegae]
MISNASLQDWARDTVPEDFEGGLVISPPVDLNSIFSGHGTALDAAAASGWDDAAQTVHSHAGSLFLRLSDMHRPSGQDRRNTIDDIDPDLVVGRYKEAARGALSAGLEGIEIDATSATVIDLFLESDTNTRRDRWGGGLENRLNLLTEVVDGVLSVWERERVCVRLSADLAGEAKDDGALIGALESLRDQEVGFVHLECFGLGEQEPVETLHQLRRLRAFFPYLLIVSGRFNFENAALFVESRVVDAVGGERHIYP